MIDASGPELTDDESAMLAGRAGPGVAMAMRLVVRLAAAMDAPRLRSVTGAHIDSCLYHGRSGIDFVEALADGGAEVSVPTTLNVSSLDLLHPDLYRGDPETAREAKALMDAYVGLGCEPTWTCAPYQRQARPALGEHVAWAESNAIVFANSVLGARTHRYGDFIDIAAAVTGRVPDAGLHRDENRAATVVVDVGRLSPRFLGSAAAYPIIGHVVGRHCGSDIPALVGLPPTASEDDLKALGAAAASSGSLAMFHAVGLTPEAPTLEAACGGAVPAQEPLIITAEACREARRSLATVADPTATTLRTVSLGTPHYSVAELEALVDTLDDRPIADGVDVYVSTGREYLAEARLRGWVDRLESAGVTLVVDTCTYITPILGSTDGVAMTDSAKWAYYAPGNIGVDVMFATLGECVESAVTGRVVVDEEFWADVG
jgi:predicted aconitase